MGKENLLELELWADSFKEGEFILDRIKNAFSGPEIVYIHGFVPTLTITSDSLTINFIVYGYYDSWENVPTKISSLLVFGKPDGIIYDPKKDKIIFAYEETSAVPTGNQSLQRLERVWYAAYEKIPFVYLLGKYGLHIDNNNRTVSIWPSYLALKLSSQYFVPSLTLLYGSKKEPENYKIGNSLSHLESLIAWYLKDHSKQNPKPSDLETLLKIIYQEMCKFIEGHYGGIAKNLAGSNQLSETDLFEYLTKRALSLSVDQKYSKNFKWPLAFDSEKSTYSSFDKFIPEIDSLVEQQKAWRPTEGSTVRLEPIKKVKIWSDGQTKRKERLEKKLKIKKQTSIHPDDFPEQNSKKIITTTKKILTLVDSTKDLLDCIERVFGEKTRKSIEPILNLDIPSVLYVTNSIHEGGRAFKGDPFTGQITAFSRIFSIGLNGEKERNMIAYYPNQLYSQFFDVNLKKLDNKGVKSIESNVHLILARDGIAIDPKTWSLL